MRAIGDLDVGIVSGPTGSPQLHLSIDSLEFDEEGCCTHAAGSLDRHQVEELRDACDEFLAGRIL